MLATIISEVVATMTTMRVSSEIEAIREVLQLDKLVSVPSLSASLQSANLLSLLSRVLAVCARSRKYCLSVDTKDTFHFTCVGKHEILSS